MWNSFNVVHYTEELPDTRGVFFPSFSCFYSLWQNKKIRKTGCQSPENRFRPSDSSSSTPTAVSRPVCRSVHLSSSFYSPSSLTPSLSVTPSASVFVSKVTALIIDAVWIRLCLLTVKRKKKILVSHLDCCHHACMAFLLLPWFRGYDLYAV